jgi:tetratricopeptide (TPR) repeat protein
MKSSPYKQFWLLCLFFLCFAAHSSQSPAASRSLTYERALAAYKKAYPGAVIKLLAKPQNADDHCLRGLTNQKALFGTGSPDFEKAVALDDTKPASIAHLAVALMQEKRTDHARVLLRNALAKNGSSLELQSTYGLCLVKKGRPESGFPSMQSALAKAPKSILCLENLANGYLESFDSQKAESYFSKLVTLQPDNVWPLLQRATLYTESGKKELALADYNAALKLSPRSQTVNWKRAGFYLKNRQYKEAVEDCKRCLESDENVVAIRRRCLRTKVDAEEHLGNFPAAARDLEELNQVSIGAPRLSWGMRNDLIRQVALFERAKNYAKALETIKLLEKFYPAKTEVLFLKARVLGKDGKFAQSLTICDSLIARDDTLSEWHTMRATALNGLGRKAEAQKELEIAKQKGRDAEQMPDLFEYRINK